MKRLISLAALALAGLAVTAAPAYAAGKTAPSCLTIKLDDRGAQDDLWVWNTCKTDQSFYVKLAHGPDGYCTAMWAKTGPQHFTWEWPQRFDGLVSC